MKSSRENTEKPRPDIDFLTRDYSGFRKLLIDRIDQTCKSWSERSAADAGIVVVELLANQLDHLSYAADRVAAEGFLASARRRESVRKHALLADYRLDRGSATGGFQHFHVKTGSQCNLPAGTRVSTHLERGDDPDERLIVETTVEARLDWRRNELRLAQAAASGTSILQLADLDGNPVNLRKIGFRPEMALALTARDQSEVVMLKTVQGSKAFLQASLNYTWRVGEGSGATQVWGNLVATRRGARVDWTRIGFGGAEREQISSSQFLAGRLLVARRLRDEVEFVRERWQDRNSLVARWNLALVTVRIVLQSLRDTSSAALTSDYVDSLDQRIISASNELRRILSEVDQPLPPGTRPGSRVAVVNQRLPVPSTLAPLTFGERSSLEIRVGVGGRFVPWTEVDNFLRSVPGDRHYVLEFGSNGRASLLFGNGRLGEVIPPGAPVMARWIDGDPAGADLAASSLEVILDSVDGLDPEAPTTNPVPTFGSRPIEAITGIADRIEANLSRQVLPVTQHDYIAMVTAHPRVDEAVVISSRGACVHLVILPKSGFPGDEVRLEVQQWLRRDRLAGTDVRVELPRTVYVSVEALLKLKPGAEKARVQNLARDALLGQFESVPRLSRSRTSAECRAVLGSIPGLLWSQLSVFDLPQASPPTVKEEIVVQQDQQIRCLNLPDRSATGQVRFWIVRNYSLELEQCYFDPDSLPDPEATWRSVQAILSGLGSIPRREGWNVLTRSNLEATVQQWCGGNAEAILRVRLLAVEQHTVDEIPLQTDEVPWLDVLKIYPVRYSTLDFSLRVEVTLSQDNSISEDQIRSDILVQISGLSGKPWTQCWFELTLPSLTEVLPTLEAVKSMTATALWAGTVPASRVLVPNGSVPVVNVLEIVFC